MDTILEDGSTDEKVDDCDSLFETANLLTHLIYNKYNINTKIIPFNHSSLDTFFSFNMSVDMFSEFSFFFMSSINYS